MQRLSYLDVYWENFHYITILFLYNQVTWLNVCCCVAPFALRGKSKAPPVVFLSAFVLACCPCSLYVTCPNNWNKHRSWFIPTNPKQVCRLQLSFILRSRNLGGSRAAWWEEGPLAARTGVCPVTNHLTLQQISHHYLGLELGVSHGFFLCVCVCFFVCLWLQMSLCLWNVMEKA